MLTFSTKKKANIWKKHQNILNTAFNWLGFPFHGIWKKVINHCISNLSSIYPTDNILKKFSPNNVELNLDSNHNSSQFWNCILSTIYTIFRLTLKQLWINIRQKVISTKQTYNLIELRSRMNLLILVVDCLSSFPSSNFLENTVKSLNAVLFMTKWSS